MNKHLISNLRKKSRQRNTRPRWYDVECRMKRAEAIKAGERVTTMEEKTILISHAVNIEHLSRRNNEYIKKMCARNKRFFFNDRPNLWKALNKLWPYGNNTNMPGRDEFYSHFKGMAGENHNLNFDYRNEIEAIPYLQNEKKTASHQPYALWNTTCWIATSLLAKKSLDKYVT